MLDFNVNVQIDFLKWLYREAIQIANLESEHIKRLIDLSEKYSDVPMDLADGSLLVVSEMTGIQNIIAIDTDYYIYRITIQSALGAREIEWVDGWASKEPVPREVGEIELYFLSIVERLRNDDSTQSAGERAEQIAKEFIVQAPTFKFDGLIETVNIIETRILESFPVQYIVLIEFDSRHGGYGDRMGQFLPQVITSHHAEIRVVNDNVVSAILDDQWDEINQKQLD